MKVGELFDLDLLQRMIDTGMVRVQRHPTEDLIIHNYSAQCQYAREWNEVTEACRGLITTTDGTVVARPFRKFFNYGEYKAEEIDLEAPVEVTDKMDGSLGILYPASDGWAIATRGSFMSDQAKWATAYLREYIDDSVFEHGRTYLFEILASWNRIVVRYDWQGLVLLTIIDNETGHHLALPTQDTLQTWTRVHSREYLYSSEDRVALLRPVQEELAEQGLRDTQRSSQILSQDLERTKPREGPRVSSRDSARDNTSDSNCQGGQSMSGLSTDISSDLHGLRSRPRGEEVLSSSMQEFDTVSRRNSQVRDSLFQLPSPQDIGSQAVRVVELFQYSTLREALEAPMRENAEGLVVRYVDTQKMLKIKQEDYVTLHRIMTGMSAKNIWEVVAVQACKDLITKPEHWASYLGIDPERAAEILEMKEDWLESVPDEFYTWVEKVTSDLESHFVQEWETAMMAVTVARPMYDKRLRYEYLSQDIYAKQIIHLLDKGDNSMLRFKIWREAEPEPTRPFAISEDTA